MKTFDIIMIILSVLLIGSFVFMQFYMTYAPRVLADWLEKELEKAEKTGKNRSGKDGSVVESVDSGTE